jgi:hypothetical protein
MEVEREMDMVRWRSGGTFPSTIATQQQMCFKTVLIMVFSTLGKLALSTLGRCEDDHSVLNKYAFDSSNVSHRIQSRIWPSDHEESQSIPAQQMRRARNVHYGYSLNRND